MNDLKTMEEKYKARRDVEFFNALEKVLDEYFPKIEEEGPEKIANKRGPALALFSEAVVLHNFALSLHSQKIREGIEERRHTAQNCECEGFGCPRNSTIEDILKIRELTPPTNI